MSADPENEYFSDGISEELINALTQFPKLKVIARTSAFSFKGKNVAIREIGRTLGVRHVLEGSGRRSGGQLRITAQLIDVADGSHQWSGRYDRQLDDVFAIQDEVTAAVREAVGARLFSGGQVQRRHRTDSETYATSLRGRHYQTREAERALEALACHEEAAARDPAFAPELAWAGRAHTVSSY